jgi:spore coat protein YutH
MLNIHYRIQSDNKVFLGDKEGYRQGDNIYVTISGKNRETILMEQAVLSYYLRDNSLEMLAIPIPNLNGEWYTSYKDESWMVLHIKEESRLNDKPIGLQLAELHKVGGTFSYEPKAISSYGKWKELWIEKLTTFEEAIEYQARKAPSDYYRTLMDYLPYLIGISENAIQYLQESEREKRILDTDQGTTTFIRFDQFMEQSIIWTDQLAYDHPTRDIAEYIRSSFLKNDNPKKIINFLNDYQTISPLSIFGWRLVYARLLFPIQLFDFIEQGFTKPQEENELKRMIIIQTTYEKQLRDFYQMIGVDTEKWEIPVVHWL